MKKIAIGALIVYAAMSQFTDTLTSEQDLLNQNTQTLVDQTLVTQNSGGDPNLIDPRIQVDFLPTQLIESPIISQLQPDSIQQSQQNLFVDSSRIETPTVIQTNRNINNIDQRLIIDDRRLNLNNLRKDDWKFDDRRQNDLIRSNDRIDWRNNNVNIGQRFNQIDQRSWNINPKEQLFRQQNTFRVPITSNQQYDNNLSQHLNRMHNVVYNSWRK